MQHGQQKHEHMSLHIEPYTHTYTYNIRIQYASGACTKSRCTRLTVAASHTLNLQLTLTTLSK